MVTAQLGWRAEVQRSAIAPSISKKASWRRGPLKDVADLLGEKTTAAGRTTCLLG